MRFDLIASQFVVGFREEPNTVFTCCWYLDHRDACRRVVCNDNTVDVDTIFSEVLTNVDAKWVVTDTGDKPMSAFSRAAAPPLGLRLARRDDLSLP